MYFIFPAPSAPLPHIQYIDIIKVDEKKDNKKKNKGKSKQTKEGGGGGGGGGRRGLVKNITKI